MNKTSKEIIELTKKFCKHEGSFNKTKRELYKRVRKIKHAEAVKLWDEHLRDIIESHYQNEYDNSNKAYRGETTAKVYARNWKYYFLSLTVGYKKAKKKSRRIEVDKVGNAGGDAGDTIGPWKIWDCGELNMEQVEMAVACLDSIVDKETLDNVLKQVRINRKH